LSTVRRTSASGWTEKKIEIAMFHLDYLSCFLTVLATILLARKSWIGLVVAIVNSLIVCAIGLRTLQLGFIPANLFCICIYAISMRSWLKKQTHTKRDHTQAQDNNFVADGPRVNTAMQHRIYFWFSHECFALRSKTPGAPPKRLRNS
jgi:hypothetical protein